VNKDIHNLLGGDDKKTKKYKLTKLLTINKDENEITL